MTNFKFTRGKVWTPQERLEFIQRHELAHNIKGGNVLGEGELYQILEGGIPELISLGIKNTGTSKEKIENMVESFVRANKEEFDATKRETLRKFNRVLERRHETGHSHGYNCTWRKCFAFSHKNFMVCGSHGDEEVDEYNLNPEAFENHKFYNPSTDTTTSFLMMPHRLFT